MTAGKKSAFAGYLCGAHPPDNAQFGHFALPLLSWFIKLPKFVLTAVVQFLEGFRVINSHCFGSLRKALPFVTTSIMWNALTQKGSELYIARGLRVHNMVNSNAFLKNCSPTTVFFAINST